MFRNFLSVGCIFFSLFALPVSAVAQCLSYPVPFQERISNASTILLGSVVDRHCYTDEKGNIYTLNKIAVDAWIKNHSSSEHLFVITLGGVLGDKAQITYPAVQLKRSERYFFILEGDNTLVDDPNIRINYPGTIQAMPYADAQGAWLYQGGKYHDLFTEGALTETALLQKINLLYGLVARRSDGSLYIPKEGSGKNGATNDITGFTPAITDAGTVDPSDYLTITGSGFGSSPGTVSFPNADNGGSTQILPPNTSDYITWTDNTIIVKVPTGENSNAGSGFFIVNGTFSSPASLTVRYSHISINNDFSGFPTPTRQRYYLRNMDGLGGYTFVYGSSFSSNAAAIASFERALNTWRCNTGINWRANGSTVAGYADDNENVVLFDASLPPGVLARATSRLQGSATGACNLHNTVWWQEEIDIQARASGITWQFGPALATGGQYDFETVILHELGHAHGLGHRIAFGQLMNFSVSNATNIRTPAPQEIQGGQDKMAYSIIPTCFNPTNSGTPMIPATCVNPLQLLSFTGELRKFGTELKWTTQNEVNVDRFEVQRSISNTDFTAIGSVKAAGNSVTELRYQLIDGNVQQGIHYYRLKMIDKDGTYEYSPVVTIKVAEPVKALSVYPNPGRNELFIAAAFKTTVHLIDASGKTVRMINLNAGSNKVDVGNLSNGIYYLGHKHSTSRIKVMIMH